MKKHAKEVFMIYFDTHAHYLSDRFKIDRHKVLLDAYRNGVKYIVNSTSTLELDAGLRLSQKYDFIYLSIGDCCSWTTGLAGDEYISDEILTKMIKFCKKNKKVVAWGEIGLGLNKAEYVIGRGKENQVYWFKKQLDAAKHAKLPVIIHSRDACQLVFNILSKADMPDYGYGKGMIHCYSGTPDMALKYIKMGYLISIGGIVTYRGASNLVETVKRIPINKILLETDCPYLTPEPNRRQRNNSNNLKLIVNKIADIKKISPERVSKITTSNAKLLFRIK